MSIMTARHVTANVPADVLEAAMDVTGKEITGTLIDGLLRIRRAGVYRKAMRLKAKIALDVDLDASRERRRR